MIRRIFTWFVVLGGVRKGDAYLCLRICICEFVFAYLYLPICICVFVLFDDNPNIHLVSPLGWEPGRWYLEPGSTFCQIRSYRGILL